MAFGANTGAPELRSIAALVPRGSDTVLPAWTLIDALAVFCLGFATFACLGRSYPVLIFLSCPSVAGVTVVAARLLTVVTDRTASRCGRAFRESVCGYQYARQYRQGSHGYLRV
jgi:hypothetical protein